MAENEIKSINGRKLQDEKARQDIANLQPKTDESLITTSKEITGAINELFQSVNNGKSGLETAIIDKGGIVSKAGTVATFQELIDAIATISGVSVKLNSISLLKEGWKFKLISSTANTNYNSTTETTKLFDDSSWNTVTVPHDWSIYNEFNPRSPSTYEGGHLDGGDAWYRIKLNTSNLENQKVYVYFDGVYMESDIYINGTKVGDNKWYNPFTLDITDYLDYDGNDVLTVFVRNQQPSSRWYSGSGIIRNVYLIGANEVEVGLHDIKITTPNLETEYNSNVTTNIELVIKNKNASNSTYKVKNTIYYLDNQVATSTEDLVLDGNSTQSFTTNLIVNKPNLWDEYAGNLYVLKTELINTQNETIFSTQNKFGYRYFKFDKDNGFYLNGKSLKIRGVCLHHDLGCIGAEANRSGIERQVRLLKEMGCNAIRTTHNPGSQEMLDVCAEQGIMVVEEMFDCWTSPKKQYDFARYYNDRYEEVIETTVKRGRNNPAVIMWSIGNEITRTSQNYDIATATGFVTNMINKIHEFDTTRPITMGEDRPNDSVAKACMSLLDVVGVNYGNETEYFNLRNVYPEFKVYGSETTSALSSRGKYARDDVNYYCSSFDDDNVSWGDPASTALKRHMDSSYLAGMFVWTGFDYIGEPTPFNKTNTNLSYFGIYDTCGFPKDIKYMYQSRWTTKPMIHILPHWNHESGNIRVWIYSNCHKVELFLNGSSLGAKLQTNIGSKYQFEYNVAYTKGTLVANGYDESDNVIAQDIIYTALDTPSTVKLTSDKTSVNINSDDLVFITCDIVDVNGTFCPNATNEITFTVNGGSVVGTDNGDSTCATKMRTNKKVAFSGKVLAVVKPDKSTGTMTITATGAGLRGKSITVTKSNITTLTSKPVQSFIDATNPTIYDYGDATKPCTNIVLDNSTLTIDGSISTTATLIATVTPSDTTDNITWSVNPTGIVTVDNGLVTAIANGVATVTATCGSQTATCSINVALPIVECTSISLDRDTLSLSGSSGSGNLLTGVHNAIVSKNVKFDAITLQPGIYKFTNIGDGSFTYLGYTINSEAKQEPSGNTTNPVVFELTETSSVVLNAFPNNVATNTYDKLGLYKVTEGQRIPLVVAGDGYYGNTATITPSLNDKYVETVTLDATKCYVLKYTGTSTLARKNICCVMNDTLYTNQVEINTGDTVRLINNISSMKLSCNISRGNTIDDLVLYEALNTDTTYQLTATVTPDNCNQLVTWSVSPTGIVTVDNGLVTAIANGVATVTATCGSQTATCDITVSNMTE